MILVNVKATWPLVLAGHYSAAEATLGRWYRIPEARIEEYGDALAGVFRGHIVTVYDIHDFSRDADERVTFTGSPSIRWSPLIGSPAPNPWKPGQGWPVKYVDSALLAGATGGAA